MVVAGHTFGLLAALLYVCLLVVIYVLRDRWPLFRHLAGRKACLTSISIVLFLLLVFGLVPQDGGGDGFFGVLGFRNMSRSPIFILALLLLATSVTLNTIEDIHRFSKHRLGVTCAHLGLSSHFCTCSSCTKPRSSARKNSFRSNSSNSPWSATSLMLSGSW